MYYCIALKLQYEIIKYKAQATDNELNDPKP